MGLIKKDINPNVSVPALRKDFKVQPLFWDKKKKQILRLICDSEYSIKQIAEVVSLAPWKVAKYIRDETFQQRYLEILEAGTQQLVGERKRLLKEVMEIMRKEVINNVRKMNPNTILKEYRLILQGYDQEESKVTPRFQQNIFSTKLVSSKAARLFEKAVLEAGGYKPLKASDKEIIEIQNDQIQPRAKKSGGN